MTTDRSGMSLDDVYRKIDWLSHEAYENDMSYAGDELAKCAASLKEHLSRYAVVTANDDIKKWLADPETVLVWMLRGIIAVPSHKAMADRFWDSEFSDESFAARHATVPDELNPPDYVTEMYPPDPGGMRSYMPRGVKITHKPTGITVACAHERSQHKNRDVALAGIKAMLAQRDGGK